MDGKKIVEELKRNMSTTAFGEPQYKLDLESGRKIVVTYEKEGIPEEEQYYSIRLYSNEEERNIKYFKTQGQIIHLVTERVSEEELIEKIKEVLRMFPDNIKGNEENQQKNAEDVFEYENLHFKALNKLENCIPKKSDSLYSISKYLRSDQEMLKNYQYDNFYAAAKNSEADIFLCIETGKKYIPGNNELFEFDETPMKRKSKGR